MEQASMTARLCLFLRACHTVSFPVKVLDDPPARQLLTDGEFQQTAAALLQGLPFLAPDFQGTGQEALCCAVNRRLSPAPLGRAVFAEQCMERAAAAGAEQALLLGAGYDTFAYRQPAWAKRLRIFEVDHPATMADKQRRVRAAGLPAPDNTWYIPADLTQPRWWEGLLRCPGFSPQTVSVCSLLGLVYYLSAPALDALLADLETLLPAGSTLVLDYTVPQPQTQRLAQMAAAAGEPMQTGWSSKALTALLEQHGFLIRELLEPQDITERFFADFDRAEPRFPLIAPEDLRFCRAVRR